MRAVLIREPGDPSVLSLGITTDPEVRHGEVLIRVRASALNRADLLQRRGFYPPPPGTDPAIPGLECAGVVEESLDPTGQVKPGERVMTLLPGAGYAEYVAVPAGLVMPVPEALSFVEAAAIPEVFLTAFDAIFLQLEVSLGETVLIHAAGSGVGTAAIQLLRVAGVHSIGTSRQDEKLAKCLELGLEHGLNPAAGDWVQRSRELTRGKGVQAILDLVGGAYLHGNLECLAECGRMIVVGTLTGRQSVIDLGTVLRKRLQVRGTALRPRGLGEKLALVEQFSNRILPMFENGALRPVIDRVYPWQEVAEAHRRMEHNANFGKIVLSVE